MSPYEHTLSLSPPPQRSVSINH